MKLHSLIQERIKAHCELFWQFTFWLNFLRKSFSSKLTSVRDLICGNSRTFLFRIFCKVVTPTSSSTSGHNTSSNSSFSLSSLSLVTTEVLVVSEIERNRWRRVVLSGSPHSSSSSAAALFPLSIKVVVASGLLSFALLPRHSQLPQRPHDSRLQPARPFVDDEEGVADNLRKHLSLNNLMHESVILSATLWLSLSSAIFK